MITPDRNGLVGVASFVVNSRFIQGHGTDIFQYKGEVTDEYVAVCKELNNLVSEVLDDLEKIRTSVVKTLTAIAEKGRDSQV